MEGLILKLTSTQTFLIQIFIMEVFLDLLVPLHKNRNRYDPSKYRGISITTNIYKVNYNR